MTVPRTLLNSANHRATLEWSAVAPEEEETGFGFISPLLSSPSFSSSTSVTGISRHVLDFQPQLCETPKSSGPELNIVALVPVALGHVILK